MQEIKLKKNNCFFFFRFKIRTSRISIWKEFKYLSYSSTPLTKFNGGMIHG